MVALVVETGTGSATANTYISQADATTYHAKHLYATDWTAASTGDKDIDLMMATRIIDDSFEFDGRKIGDTQALEWPRFDIKDRSDFLIPSTTIPAALKNAVAEYGRWLLGADRTAETGDRGFKSMKVGSLSLTPDPGDRTAIIPKIVADMLEPFATNRGGLSISVER